MHFWAGVYQTFRTWTTKVSLTPIIIESFKAQIGWVPGNQANVFVTNHDTERVRCFGSMTWRMFKRRRNQSGASLNINSPSNTYILATIFSLAHPYGTPTVLSSYSYSNADDGAPNGGLVLLVIYVMRIKHLNLGYGTCSGTGGSGGWLCQHRYVAISGMVGFRNNVTSAGMSNWVSPQSDRIAFGRGMLHFP